MVMVKAHPREVFYFGPDGMGYLRVRKSPSRPRRVVVVTRKDDWGALLTRKGGRN